MKGLFCFVKKILTIFLAMTLCTALFSACSSRSDGSSSSEDASSSAESSSAEASSGAADVSIPSVSEAKENNQHIDAEKINLVQFDEQSDDALRAIIVTSVGEIEAVLYPDLAPKAVESFVALAKEGFYDDKPFHFVDQGNMIQTGALNSNGTGFSSGIKDASGDPVFFEDEITWDLWHFRGALSLAHNQDGLNGSQFSIIQADSIYHYAKSDLEESLFPQKVIDKYEQVGGTPHRDFYQTIFGMVVEGFDVLDELAAVEVDASKTPATPATILSIAIIGDSGPAGDSGADTSGGDAESGSQEEASA